MTHYFGDLAPLNKIAIMTTNRRNFLRNVSLGAGALAASTSSFAFEATDEQLNHSAELEKKKQRFNMSGYAAPILDVVRVGIIGLGMRGGDAVGRLSYIDGLEINGSGGRHVFAWPYNHKTLGAPVARKI